MDAGTVAGSFKGKTTLITGSTGFLGKLLVEKILRVQPDVKKLFLLVRAPDAASARQRVETEVLGMDLFSVLREKHGTHFNSFTKGKIAPLAGDIIHENFGLESSQVDELSKEIDIIVNVAATTNFYERYDVALASNALGAKHVCEFAKRCAHLKMLLHVSTAYVAGEQEGLILEKPFQIGETLKMGLYLDIEAELQLVDKVKAELMRLCSYGSSEKLEKTTMKELGMKRATHFGWPNTYVFTKAIGEMLIGHLRGDLPVVIIRPSIVTSTYQDPLPGWIEGTRTIDALIVSYAEQTLPCFIEGHNLIIDVIPGDMVVNVMIVAMATHLCDQQQITIYHVSSSLRNPLPASIFRDSLYRYFCANPHMVKNGKITIRNERTLMFNRYTSFCVYMFLMYKLPLEMLHLVSLLFGGLFSRAYDKLNRRYNLVMLLAKLYAPYAFFKGRFDDMNLERLRVATGRNHSGGYIFNFDPKSIDWDSYFYNIHVPGVLKYACEKKQGRM